MDFRGSLPPLLFSRLVHAIQRRLGCAVNWLQPGCALLSIDDPQFALTIEHLWVAHRLRVVVFPAAQAPLTLRVIRTLVARLAAARWREGALDFFAGIDDGSNGDAYECDAVRCTLVDIDECVPVEEEREPEEEDDEDDEVEGWWETLDGRELPEKVVVRLEQWRPWEEAAAQRAAEAVVAAAEAAAAAAAAAAAHAEHKAVAVAAAAAMVGAESEAVAAAASAAKAAAAAAVDAAAEEVVAEEVEIGRTARTSW